MLKLDKLRDFDHDVLRNIVSLRTSEDLFDDLHDGDSDSFMVAITAESRVKKHVSIGQIDRGFYYSTAINYPFETEAYLATRYSNGSYPAWYASLDLKTTIYETTYHMLKAEMAIEGLEEIITRERAVYDIHCKSTLIDLTVHEEFYSSLVHPDSYDFTHQIGGRIQREGYPGLIAPSARYARGKNVAIFNRQILSSPRLKCYLTYRLNPIKKKVSVWRQPEKIWLNVTF